MIYLIYDTHDNDYSVWSTTNDNFQGLYFYLPIDVPADTPAWFSNPPLLNDYQEIPDNSPNDMGLLTQRNFMCIASFESITDYQKYRESCYELLI